MIIGTAGHIDHGKTSLVRALTGVDADRLKEEKVRGITIDLGFAYMPAPDGTVVGFVDVPGHERLIRNMLAGATGIAFALLVVAADDGVMPQTREHLAILDLLGLRRGLVALTKTDLVDADGIAAARAGVANALLGTGLEDAAIVEVSSATGAGIDDLRARLVVAAETGAAPAADAPFRLAVDRSFTLQGAGTVVTGTVLAGSVAPGDHLVASPSGLAVRVRGLHAQNRAAERGRPGDRCALNLAGDGVARDAIARGAMIVDPWLHAPTARIDAELRVLPGEPRPVAQWLPVHLHHGTAEVPARVVLLADRAIAPGERGLVQLVLDRPIAAAAGDRFVIRDTSAQRTIGGGSFLDLRAPTRRRRTPERLAQLAAHAAPDPAAALDALLTRAPYHLDLYAFARDRGLRAEALAAAAGDVVTIATRAARIALTRATAERLERAILATLEAFHAENPDLAGIGMERLRGGIDPRLPSPAFAALLQAEARAGRVALDGAWVRLAGHEVRLAPADEELWDAIAPRLAAEARFRPPRVRDIAGELDLPEEEVRRLCKLLARMGKLHEVAHDHFFLRDTVGEMVGFAADLDATVGLFSAAQFRDRMQNGRKVAIQILEFLDRHGVTVRRGDLRRINPRRLDLFRRDDAEETPSGGESSPVGRPDFKSGRGRETVSGGFDSHSLPPQEQRSTA
jgi:selenocysteine-specific elongation factor